MTVMQALKKMVDEQTVFVVYNYPTPEVDWATARPALNKPTNDIQGVVWQDSIGIWTARFSRLITMNEILNYQIKEHIAKNSISIYDLNPSNNSLQSTPLQYALVECTHSWKHYEGIMDSFDFCEKCDEKKR